MNSIVSFTNGKNELSFEKEENKVKISIRIVTPNQTNITTVKVNKPNIKKIINLLTTI